MSFVYFDKAAIVNLSNHEIKTISISDKYKQQYVGGRGFIARWLFEMVPPEVDALDEENTLIFATGALTGTLAPTSARLAVGAKAPETGIWSIGNVGGNMGLQLKRAGLDALIIQGKSAEKVYILIQNAEITIHPADHVWGMDTCQTDSIIKQEVHDQWLSIACIGPAGENQVLLSTIMIDRVRSCGRGGLGAVMGSKNLKAIAVHGNQNITIYDPDNFYQECLKVINKSAQLYFKKRWEKGTYGALRRYNDAGALSTRNGQQTCFEGISGIEADTYVKQFKQHQVHACFGCSIPCWSYYYIKEGKYAGFYDNNVNATTFKEFGARCGLANMDAILVANAACNRFGLDTISTPATIAFAMECFQNGVLTKSDTQNLELTWGNDKVILELIDQIAHKQGLGAQLSQGVKRCAENWGPQAEPYALHVKGLETVATDPRGQPSWGLGYATSSRGACHMRAYANYEYHGINEKAMLKIAGTIEISERFGHKGKGKAGAYLENLRAVGDTIGMCHFLTSGELGFTEVLAPLYETATGIPMTPNDLFHVGERVYNLERISNLLYGLTPSDDTLPDRYLYEPVPEGPAKGKVCPLEPMIEEYYLARDWDLITGFPSKNKLKELDLLELVPPKYL